MAPPPQVRVHPSDLRSMQARMTVAHLNYVRHRVGAARPYVH